jgi:hypothetical protein
MVIMGEHALHYAIQQYLAHHHHKRNHQGLANQLITPEPDLWSHHSQVRCRDCLGGLLSHYHREVA